MNHQISASQYINQEIIKKGKHLFDNYMTEVLNKKIDKKRKPQVQENKPSWSVYNLTQIVVPSLKIDEIIAEELIKTNILHQRDQANDQQDFRLYEDYENSRRVSKKFMKRFVKPVKQHNETAALSKSNKSLQQIFNDKVKFLMKNQTEVQFDLIKSNAQIKPKLQNKMQNIEQINQKMIFFGSNILTAFDKLIQRKNMVQFKENLIKQIHSDIWSYFTLLQKQKATQFYKLGLHEKFKTNIKQCLPQYLHFQQNPNQYSSIQSTWNTSLLQKQILKLNSRKITGKVLYKYEHDILQLKQTKLRNRIHVMEKIPFQNLKKYFSKKETKQRAPTIIISENLINNQLKGYPQQNNRVNRTNMFFQEKVVGISRNNQQESNRGPINQLINRNFSNFQQKRNFVTEINNGSRTQTNGNYLQQEKLPKKSRQKIIRYQEPPIKTFVTSNQPIKKSSGNSQNSFTSFGNYNSLKSFNLKNKPPPSADYLTNETLNLDKCNFFKNSLVGPQSNQASMNFNNFTNQNMFSNRSNIKRPRNIYLNPQSKKLNYENVNKLTSNNYPGRQRSNESPSVSKISQNQSWYQKQLKQDIKQTKKKKQPLIRVPSFSPSFVINHRQIKKNISQHFYPIKIGNLMIERFNKIYLEYNSQRQVLKNFIVKFLIDRLKHNVVNVQIVIPSALLIQEGLSNKTSKQNQKVKQMIKIITSLGGQISMLKPESAYRAKSLQKQKQNNRNNQILSNISPQLSIYKYFYPELSYHDIINNLDLQNYYIEKQSQIKKVGDWKY